MSDEQTRLLQQILEVNREQLELFKRHRDEIMVVQQTALRGQNKSLWMSRIALGFLLVAAAFMIFVMYVSFTHTPEPPPQLAPSTVLREP